MSLPIPQPPAVPFLGNVINIEREVPQRSFNLLAEQYGPIYRLNLLGRKIVVLNNYELYSEASDDKRFEKALSGGLRQVRNLVHDGLFTAEGQEPNWGIAHRLLMPAFGTAAIRGMFDDMNDIISQLITKWERFGPDNIINPAEDFTRLTLDAIALSSMSYRLNSFYLETPHPFAQSMFDFLTESGAHANRPALVHAFMKKTQAKYEEDIRSMTELALSIVDKRKAHPVDKRDLLSLMLEGTDPKTGQGMTKESIVDNLITFLIAGHETTSGMLTFAVYHLGRNPDALAKLRAEIDEVLRGEPIQLTDIAKMPYTVAVMRETLRLSPTAPMRSVRSLESTTIGGGKYRIEPDETVVQNTFFMHRDPTVWGDDAEEFNPDRMLDGKFEALPPNAWQPFGFGARGCIGRAFAWQEAHMTIATVYQKFDLVFTDPCYVLELKQALTIKPANFYIRAIPRSRSPRPYALPSSDLLKSREVNPARPGTIAPAVAEADVNKQPLYVLYGSNTGTSESFAQRIATDAPTHGFKATMGSLDSAAEHLPNDGPIVIVTASFEGEPADNAAHFFNWLSNLKGDQFANIRYAVFGCGNHDWVQTYQRIPRLVDQLFSDRGGRRLIERGEGDAGGADIFRDFDQWEIALFETLSNEYKTVESAPTSMINITNVDSGTTRAATLHQMDAALGEVMENKVLTAPGKPIKRHIEFQLPEGQNYRAGDYLAVLPVNPSRDVGRVLSHFKLSGEQEISLSSTGPTALPVGRPISLSSLLSGYVELSQPATPRNIRTLIAAENSEQSTNILNALESSYADQVLFKRLSVLDILQANTDIKLSFGAYLEMLPPMRIRQYSISSSPLWNPQRATLTISVINVPAISGREEPFLGVASNYLDNLRPGDKVQIAIRQSAAFHLPTDPATPVVMFCAGSGVAPMRGFIQERALQKAAGRDVGKMLLFFGCRSPQEDYLYSNTDLSDWVKLGVLDVRPVFSRASEESAGCKYVQHRVWEDRADIIKMFGNGAKFYVCGSGKVANGIKEKLVAIISEYDGIDNTEAAAKMERFTKASRFATDIFE